MTTATELRVRVTVPEVWDHVQIAADPSWPIRQVKEEALRATTGGDANAEAFEVKFRGAKVLDESATLAQLRVPDNGALVVLRARRQPVR